MKPAQMTAKNHVIVGTESATAVRLPAAAGQIAASVETKSVMQHAVRIEKPAHKIAHRNHGAFYQLNKNRPIGGGFYLNRKGIILIS
jgi:hypothetical protein